MQIGLERTTANAGGDFATSITSANASGIHATRDFIGWVVLFRPRRPIFGGLSRTSTARRLVFPLSQPHVPSPYHHHKAHGPEKTTTRRWGGESSRRVTGAEDAAWGCANGGWRAKSREQERPDADEGDHHGPPPDAKRHMNALPRGGRNIADISCVVNRRAVPCLGRGERQQSSSSCRL